MDNKKIINIAKETEEARGTYLSLKERLDNFNSHLDTIANEKADKNQVGTPLTASAVSEMTDKTKIYVNTTDGNWYYWNDTIWSIGGVYNSQGIGDNSITAKKIYGTNIQKSINVFDKTKAEVGKKIGHWYQGVTTSDDANYCITDYIEVALGDSYVVDRSGGDGFTLGIMFDKNKEPLESPKIITNGFGKQIISITDEQCKYIRVNLVIQNRTVNDVMLIKGNEYPNYYIDCEEKITIDWLNLKEKSVGIGELTEEVLDLIKENEDIRKINLPSIMYAIANKPVKLYYKSFVSGYDLGFRMTNSVFEGKYRCMKNCIIYPSKANGIQLVETNYLYDSKMNLLDSNEIKIRYNDGLSKTNPSTIKNCLIIGDSFIQGNKIPDEIINAINVTYGLTNYNFIGGKVSPNGNRHQGMGGYGFHDFVCSVDERRPAFSYNPFYNETTEKLDFKNYLSNLGVTGTLDYVIIHLGVNDYLAWKRNATQILEDAKTFINALHSDYPNCKILLNGLIPVSEENEEVNVYLYNKDIFEINKAYNDLGLDTNYSPFLKHVPVAPTFDTIHGYPYEMVQAYRDSDEMVKRLTDKLHPNDAGYNMIADCDISAFCYLI